MLEIRDLSLRIGRSQILRDVSVSLERGQILGLVGESGSGKSMTALAVMQLLPRRARLSGSVQLDETELTGLREHRMTRLRGAEIGMIFQEPMTALNPVQTIGDQVAETLLVHGAASRRAAQERAAERLARVGLAPDMIPPSRYPHELSGGQRQRVCIAMAIALRPQILIADEPTTALDVTTQAQILTLLRDLVRDEGMSLMLITHDLAVVGGMADQIAVMSAGRIVEQGPARGVLSAPRDPYTKSLLSAATHQPDRTRVQAQTQLLEVTGATRDYVLPRRTPFGPKRKLRAVNEVSFTIRRGESLGLVGESGCGKSTLSRAILGLEALQNGSIRLDGDRIGPTMPAALRQRMQVVFQDPFDSFNPRHRVGRLLLEPFHLTGRPRDAKTRVAEALESVGLQPRDARRYPHEFSGGQRQRIAIARALISRPDLIVLDEAVSALDVQVRARILDLLASLQSQFGLTYLFISHDLSVVRSVTDRVIVMQAGRIVERGLTERVFSRAEHPYTRALIAAAPKLPTTI